MNNDLIYNFIFALIEQKNKKTFLLYFQKTKINDIE